MLRLRRFSGSLKKAFKASETRFLAAAVPFAFCITYIITTKALDTLNQFSGKKSTSSNCIEKVASSDAPNPTLRICEDPLWYICIDLNLYCEAPFMDKTVRPFRSKRTIPCFLSLVSNQESALTVKRHAMKRYYGNPTFPYLTVCSYIIKSST